MERMPALRPTLAIVAILLAPVVAPAETTPATAPETVPTATQPTAAAPAFGLVNYLVLAAYLVAVVGLGAWFSRREKSTDDYFLAGRRIPWWAAGLSIFGGGLSALTYMAIPAAAFDGDWVLILTYIVPVALIPVVVAFYIPFYRRLKVTTAYEYLERRFNLPTRWFASAYYVFFQFGRMAIMLYLPAIALATVTGLNVYLAIVLMGVLAIAYTVMGGIEAVIWTDVLQVVVLSLGAALILITIAGGVAGGLTGIVSAVPPGKMTVLKGGWSLTGDVAWVMIVGSFFSAVMPNTADQSVVQRYLATTDERSARRAAWASALLGVPTGLVFFFMGTALYVFYRVAAVAPLAEDVEGAAILPHFVMTRLPAGISGLVIAGIFAAAMSTIDNGMNAIATAFTTDFYRRLRPRRDDRHYLNVARWATLLAGLIAAGVAVLVCAAGFKALFTLFYQIMNLFGGSLAGLFVLGIFTRRTSGRGALTGAIVSMGAMLLVKFGTALAAVLPVPPLAAALAQAARVHWILHSAIGLAVCVGTGYLASFPFRRRRDTTGLTIYSMPAEE